MGIRTCARFELIIDWSCLTIQKIMLGFWPRIIFDYNFEPEKGLKFRGDFFHPDWSCLTFQKILNWSSGFESQMDLWSQLRACTRFESSTLRVSFSSRLVLSDHSKSHQFLLLSSFCSFLFDSFLVVLPRVLRFPPKFL